MTEYCKELLAKTGDYGEKAKELISISPLSNIFSDRSLFSEAEEALKKLKSGKSPGTDEISSEILIAGKELLQKELQEIVNLAWKAKVISEEWTKSVVWRYQRQGIKVSVPTTELCH